LKLKQYRRSRSLALVFALGTVGASAVSMLGQDASVASFRVGANSRLGFVDGRGTIVQAPVFEYGGSRRNEGLLWVRDEASDRFSGRFVDKNGLVVTAQQFGDLHESLFEAPDPKFRDGVAVVATRTGPYAYLDTYGRVLGLTSHPALSYYRYRRDILTVRDGDRYGFVNKRGESVIPARFEDARPLHRRTGVAAVKFQGKWGLIAPDGEFRVAPRCDEILADVYEPSFWRFRVKDRWGVVDVHGTERVPPRYDAIVRIGKKVVTAKAAGGYAIVSLASGKAAPRQYENVGSIREDVVLAKWNGKWGVVSANRGVLITPRFDSVEGFDGEDGVCEVSEEHRVGLIDGSGRVLLEPTFKRISSARGGFSPVESEENLWGIVERSTGKVRVEPQYVRIKGHDCFESGLAIVRGDGGWGLLGLASNKLLVACKHTDLNRWNDLFAAESGGVYVLFDMSGGEVVSGGLGIADLPKPNALVRGYGIVRAKSGAGLITESGRIALPLKYEDLGIPSEGMIPAKRDGEWGYVDMTGTFVIAPRFGAARSFKNGVAAVKIGGRFGYIDRAGKQVVPPAYSDAGYDLNGLLPVAEEKSVDGVRVPRWGLINKRGEIVLALEYDCVEWGDLEDGKTCIYGHVCWKTISSI